MKGLYEIFGVDVNESLGDMVLDLGLDYFLYNVDALQHVDVVIDTTGNPSVIGKKRGELNPSGRLILVGQPAPKMGIAIPNLQSPCLRVLVRPSRQHRVE